MNHKAFTISTYKKYEFRDDDEIIVIRSQHIYKLFTFSLKRLSDAIAIFKIELHSSPWLGMRFPQFTKQHLNSLCPGRLSPLSMA